MLLPSVRVCARICLELALMLSPLACSASEGGQRTGLAGFLRLARGGRAIAGSGSGCGESNTREDQIMDTPISPSFVHQACLSASQGGRRCSDCARKRGTETRTTIHRHTSKSSGVLAISCKRRDAESILTSTWTTSGSSCGLLLRFLADIVISYAQTLSPAI